MRVTTFYSYKGGLGRTLLVAWAAKELARQGSKVIALDLDLEAPGLAFKLGFSRTDDLGPGMIGLLSSFQRGDPPPESLDPWLRPVAGVPGLALLPAGPLVSGRYWRDLAALSWKELFFGPDPQGVRFFHWLRETIESERHPDHLLIDARTGVTEMGGAALSLMADQILALVGMSEEGLDGTREVLRAIAGGPRAPARRTPRIGLILARMPASMASPDLQRLRESVRDFIRLEADPLSATVPVELPLVIRSEPALQVDELSVLRERGLRVEEDYHNVRKWLEGEEVPEEPPGVVVPRDPSVEALRTSIRLQTELADKQPTTYLPELARSLWNLSSALVNQGRTEEGLLSAQEALAVCSRLAVTNPDAFEQDLTFSLDNLGGMFAAVGRSEQAVEATCEAVRIFRLLAKSRPDAFEPSLAFELNRLSRRLSSLGRREEAVKVMNEAVEILRRFASSQPDAFEPDFVMSLHNLGAMLSDLGRREDAVKVMQEAVPVFRRVAEQFHDAFGPFQATSLSHLGTVLAGLGRREEALEAAQEAVQVCRRLVKSQSDKFEPDLARSLEALGSVERPQDPGSGAARFEEGLRVLLPQLRRRPRVFAELADQLAHSLREACAAAGTEADPELLEEVVRILQQAVIDD